MFTKKSLFLIIILALTIVSGGVFYFNRLSLKEPNIKEDGGSVVTPSEESPKPITDGTKEKPKEIMSVPSLDRLVPFTGGDFTSEARKQITDQSKEIVALLKQDKNLFNQWVDLGILRKSSGDIEGAKEAWEYGSYLRPHNSVTFGNLGILYGYYVHDSALAEKNFLKAIENDSKLSYLYSQLSDFYLDVLKDKTKAQQILEKGLKEIPGDQNLKETLERIKN